MIPFEFLLPYSLEEALSLLDPEDPGIRPVGGGTAVMLMMKAGVLRPTRGSVRLKLATATVQTSSIRIHNSSEPSCPPHTAARR